MRSMQFLVSAALVSLSVFHAEARQNTKAEIQKIAAVDPPKTFEIHGETDRVLVRAANADIWRTARPRLKLTRGSSVFVKPRTYTELRLESPSSKGEFTYWTNASGALGAAFILEDTPKNQGWFGLMVNYGSIVADKIRGKIRSRSEAMEVIATGTRYIMRVDPKTEETAVFVARGSVLAISGADTLRLRALQAATATVAGGLLRTTLSGSGRQRMQDIIRKNHTKFWSRFDPLWSRWYFWAGAGGVAAGATAILVSGGEKKYTGEVIIEIPGQ